MFKYTIIILVKTLIIVHSSESHVGSFAQHTLPTPRNVKGTFCFIPKLRTLHFKLRGLRIPSVDEGESVERRMQGLCRCGGRGAPLDDALTVTLVVFLRAKRASTTDLHLDLLQSVKLIITVSSFFLK